MNKLSDRIALILQEMEGPERGKQSRLARLAAVSRGLVSHWVSGLNDSMGYEYAKNLERELGYSVNWILEGREPKRSATPVAQPEGSIAVPNAKFKAVPVIGRAMGGIPDRAWTDGGYPVGASDMYADVASADPNAFIVPIEGDSMYPKFAAGSYALIEPNTEPELEDDVLVKLGDGRIMIKRLISMRGVIRLASYNSPEIISAPPEKIVWMYYAAYPVPARKVKTRI